MEKTESRNPQGIILGTPDAQVKVLETRVCGILPFSKKIANSGTGLGRHCYGCHAGAGSICHASLL
jgi:hypothetical protein